MSRLAVRLCLANATLLIVHQIDAGYRQEWLLFGLPGGNTLNLLLNLPIIALALRAWAEVHANGTQARRSESLIAGLGLLTAAIHGSFLAAGDRSFAEPISLALIGGSLLLSLLQLQRLRRS